MLLLSELDIYSRICCSNFTPFTAKDRENPLFPPKDESPRDQHRCILVVLTPPMHCGSCIPLCAPNSPTWSPSIRYPLILRLFTSITTLWLRSHHHLCHQHFHEAFTAAQQA